MNEIQTLSSVILLYLIGITVLGLVLGKRQTSEKDYFLSQTEIPAWAIMLSVVATETSALTFISVPGLAYLGNFTFLQIILGYILGRSLIAYTLLPAYYKGHLPTAYALLEKEFGINLRRISSCLFLVSRALGDSVRLFSTAIPIVFILKGFLPAEYSIESLSRLSVLILGGFTVIYTYHGGIRAVIWTDVIQTLIYLLGGVIALIMLFHLYPGNFSDFLKEASQFEKFKIFDFRLNLSEPFTFWSGIIGGAFLSMASHGVDQLIVQRLLAAHHLKAARFSLITSGFVVFFQMILFLCIGVALFVFYGGKEFSQPDLIFSKFMVENLPPVFSGIIIAAVLAAAMSTMSGSLNSLASSTLHDLILPFYRPPHLLKFSKRLTLIWAILLVGGALLYSDQKTPAVTVALAIASFTYGGLLGVFILGYFFPKTTERVAILSLISSVFSMAAFILFKPWPLAWPWYVPLGTFLTVEFRHLFHIVMRE